MILEIVAKTCLIIAYVLLISVISLGIMSIAVALMPPTASVMTHWIVAFIAVTPMGVLLWTMQNVIEYIIKW
tara:strand:- start:434 stop:649 length:216 start_codon:yes stop_codon:yes gene_type:complete